MDKTTDMFAARLFVKMAGLFCGRMNFDECWGGFFEKSQINVFSDNYSWLLRSDNFGDDPADAADFTSKRKRNVF